MLSFYHNSCVLRGKKVCIEVEIRRLWISGTLALFGTVVRHVLTSPVWKMPRTVPQLLRCLIRGSAQFVGETSVGETSVLRILRYFTGLVSCDTELATDILHRVIFSFAQTNSSSYWNLSESPNHDKKEPSFLDYLTPETRPPWLVSCHTYRA